MTSPIDVMDFFMPRNNGGEKIDLDIPGGYIYRNDDNFIDDIWPSNPDEFLDSILNENGQLEGVLDDPSPPSSDGSCLSSQNNMEFDDEILSTTLSSPGPSVSEVGMHGSDSGGSSPPHDILYTENKPIIIQKRLKPLQTVRILNTGTGSMKNGTKLIRVQSGSNPRSILLPVSVKDLRTIKIINPANLKNQIKLLGNNKKQDEDSESSSTSTSLLHLTPEESRLLAKEGIQLPTTHPLTRHEERELKRIRRKIRNKISAQDSRKRKKEYVDGLEDRVRAVTSENTGLLARIKVLQTENAGLVSQLRRLQAMVGGRRSAQPSTCLMVLMLSLALIALPNLKRDTGTDLSATDADTKESIGKRVLLFNPDPDPDDLDEFLQFPAKRAKYDADTSQWDDLSLDGVVEEKPSQRGLILDELPIDWGSEQRPFEIFDRNKSKSVIMKIQDGVGGGILQ